MSSSSRATMILYYLSTLSENHFLLLLLCYTSLLLLLYPTVLSCQAPADQIHPPSTAPSAPAAPPRPPNLTSVPTLLFALQNEWDAVVLETFNLRQQNAQLRQELSHALYKEDAAMRVLARIQKERDEARECVASLSIPSLRYFVPLMLTLLFFCICISNRALANIQSTLGGGDEE